MLAIEEEHSGRDEGNVKVLSVYWYMIHIYYPNVSHLGDSVLILGKLRINETSPFFNWRVRGVRKLGG